MKVVVIGGSGHIGTFLVPMLVEGGHEVLAVSRGTSRPYEENPAWDKVETLALDRSKEPRFAEKIAALQADVVIDLINFSLKDTKEMVAALKNTSLQHYLFCSSIWAHGRAKVLPLDANDPSKEPLCEYGKEKFKSELYLKKVYEEENFPATIIMPGQISGAGWDIIGPWGTIDLSVLQQIADGQAISLPNLGMETIHHIHGQDVAQLFYQAMTHRENALGQSFHAVTGQSITLYGYARLLYDYFGQEAQISFLPWEKWQEQIADKDKVKHAYLHLARSGAFDISRERELLGFEPKYSNVETILAAIKSYVDRGIISLEK